MDRVERWPDGDWVVRSVTGAATRKTYRCPGCDQQIRPATPHVVAWPWLGDGAPRGDDDDGPADRRHWHTTCWQARARRGPRPQRGRGAPRY